MTSDGRQFDLDELKTVILGQRLCQQANFFPDFHFWLPHRQKTEWSHLPHSSP